jgi:hypothetical protein
VAVVLSGLLPGEDEEIMEQQDGQGATPVACRKCGSGQVTGNRTGFSGGKAAAGFLLAGPLGLLGGTLGSKKLVVSCLACGHQWDPTVAPPRRLGGTEKLLVAGAAAFGFVVYISSESPGVGLASVVLALLSQIGRLLGYATA